MKSIITSDGYVFFSSPIGWVDHLKNDGTPYRIDMVTTDETIEEWIENGFAQVFEWADEWTDLGEGSFDSFSDAEAYRDAEVNRIMPTRIRRANLPFAGIVWWIECKREVTS